MVWKEKAPSAALIFGDGRVIYGHGLGVSGIRIGEVCFNTSMSGYQEILTDPSYTDQIITFTFPHIGNTGTNKDDNETANSGLRSTALGMIIGEEISNPSNYRSQAHLEKWLCSHNMIALSGVDIRAITAHIREHGMFDAALVHDKKGRFAVEEIAQQIGEWGGLEGKDLATKISHSHIKKWHEGAWQFLPNGKGKYSRKGTEKTHIAVIDFGIKSNILRQLSR
ncbi:MAG: carbamoyl-phosphate synthase domain-containing protein, partial [Parvibaculales bacterium]